MSQEIYHEGKNQCSHAIDRSTRDSSATYPQDEKADTYCELEVPFTGSESLPSETAYHLHAKDDFPDGGLRAWLVVLGVSSSLFAFGQCAVDKLYFSVPVQSSYRELLYAVALSC
jgi:hypothetical protein